MTSGRAALEKEFLRLCRLRGPEWIESVIRPLGLTGAVVTPHDIPLVALAAITRMFGGVPRPAIGVTVL